MATLDQVVKIQTNRKNAVEDIATLTRGMYNTNNPDDMIGSGISNSWLRVASTVLETDTIAHEGTGTDAVVRKGLNTAGTLVPTLAELETLKLLQSTILSGGDLMYSPAAALSESMAYITSSVDVDGQPVVVGVFNGGDRARLLQTATTAPREWVYNTTVDPDTWQEISAYGTAAFQLSVEGAGVTEIVREGSDATAVVREGDSTNGSNVVRSADFVLPTGTANSIIVAGTGVGGTGNGAAVGSFLVRNPAQIQLSDSHVFANRDLRNAGITPGGTAEIVWHTGDVSFITDQNGDGTDSVVNGTYLYTNALEKTGATDDADWSRLNAPGSGVTSVVGLSGSVTEPDIAAALGASSQQFSNTAGISFGVDAADAAVLTVSGGLTAGDISSTGGLSIDSPTLTINSGSIPANPHVRDADGVTADTNTVIADGIEVAIGSAGRFGDDTNNVSVQADSATVGSVSTLGVTTLNVGSSELTAVNFLTAQGTVIQQNGMPLNNSTRTSYSVIPGPNGGLAHIIVGVSDFAPGFENTGAPALANFLANGTYDLYLAGMRLSMGSERLGDNRRDYRFLGTNIELTFATPSEAENVDKEQIRLDLVVYG